MDYATQISKLRIPDEMVYAWQESLDLLADISLMPVALIMRAKKRQIEVFLCNSHVNNPFKRGDVTELDEGVFCETVIEHKKPLTVTNAFLDPKWSTGPCSLKGLVAYCGLPLVWPNGEVFGTLCLLDQQENQFHRREGVLLKQCQQVVEAHLMALFHKELQRQSQQSLEAKVKEQTNQLKQLNKQINQEIDNRTSAEWMLHYQRHFDSMTGLPNRAQLSYKFAELSATVTEQTALAVLYFRIDNLSSIQDLHGFATSESLINTIAQSVQRLLAESSFLVRLSIDEMLIVHKETQPVTEAVAELAAKVCHRFENSFTTSGQELKASTHIGIALYPDDAKDLDELLHKAANARLSSHNQLSTSYHFFNRMDQQRLKNRKLMLSKIPNALQQHEVTLHYQPIINLQYQNTVIGAESLIRWENPELGKVDPMSFIHLAEQHGEMLELGGFVLRSAIDKATRWQRLMSGKFQVAVNISPIQMRDKELADQIMQFLDTYELPAENLNLEITESALMQDEALAMETLTVLADNGVNITFDDFGTGLSSLCYLQKFPINTLKIDRSVIQKLGISDDADKFVQSTIKLAKPLGIQVIAAGVENQLQAELLQSYDCPAAQGFWFGRPGSAASLSQRLLLNALVLDLDE